MKMFSRSSDDKPAVDWSAIQHARMDIARQQRNWTEVKESKLVRRGPMLVHADSDAVYTPRGGNVFDPGGATLAIRPDKEDLAYYSDDNGELVFLQPDGRKWTELLERKARRLADREAERRLRVARIKAAAQR